jgi:hypothetical protein
LFTIALKTIIATSVDLHFTSLLLWIFVFTFVFIFVCRIVIGMVNVIDFCGVITWKL